MAFYDDYYDGGYGSEQYYTPPQQEFNYSYDPNQYDYSAESAYYGQPAYQDTYQYDVAPEQYVPPTWMSEPSAADQQPAWYETAAKGLGDYVKNNPKDALGMGVGAGLGLWGLLRGTEKPAAPDTSGVDATQAMLRAELEKMKTQNADAQARMQRLIAGDYGDFQDEAAVRQAANAKIQELMQRGPDGRTPQEEEALAQIDADYAHRGLLGSSLHQKARQSALDAMRGSAQGRYESAIQSYQNLGTAKGNTQRGVYQDTANLVGQGNQQQIQGLGTLANAGLGAASLKYGADKANADIENNRTQQLLNLGGQVFGQSITKDPYAEYLKRQKTPNTTGVRLS